MTPVFDVQVRSGRGVWTIRVIANTPTKAKLYAVRGIHRVHGHRWPGKLRTKARQVGETAGSGPRIIAWRLRD